VLQYYKAACFTLTTKVVNIQNPTKVGRLILILTVISVRKITENRNFKNRKMSNQEYLSLAPGIGGSFSYGWRKMFDNAFLYLLVAVIITGILNGPVSAGWKADGDFGWSGLVLLPLMIFGLAYTFMFMPVIKFGEKFLFLKAMRNEEADLKLLFDGFRSNYLNIVLANLIVFALVMIGMVMLFIPGIIVACRLVFVPLLVMDKNLEPMKAVERSWQMTKDGHYFNIHFYWGVNCFFCWCSYFIYVGSRRICNFIPIHFKSG
jgi:hypothetical protein